jgi:aquaporin Z
MGTAGGGFGMIGAIRSHWPEYLIEALLLGAFMVSACLATAAVEHPASAVRRRLSSAPARRLVIGVLMGLTAIALIYSPWGQRSGAHMNPAATLTFLALGRIMPWDAAFYVFAQFMGGAAGVLAAGAILRSAIRHESVAYAVTRPGPLGSGMAWAAEFLISGLMMFTVLTASNHEGLAPYTGFFAAGLLCLFILFEAPLSGMSLNPARTLGSGLLAGQFPSLWVYFTAPPLAMLAAAGLYVALSGEVFCAKVNHEGDARCIFRCRVHEMRTPGAGFGIEP